MKIVPLLVPFSIVACFLSAPIEPDPYWRESIREDPLTQDVYYRSVAGAFSECDPRVRVEARSGDRLLVFLPDGHLLVMNGSVESYPEDGDRRVELISRYSSESIPGCPHPRVERGRAPANS